MDKDVSWRPGFPALRSCHPWLCCPSPCQHPSTLEGEEGVAEVRPCRTLGRRGLHPVSLRQRADPRPARAHAGTSIVSSTAGLLWNAAECPLSFQVTVNATNAQPLGQQLVAFTSRASHFTDVMDVIFVTHLVERLTRLVERHKDVRTLRHGNC